MDGSRIFWGKAAVVLAAIPVLLYGYEFGPDAGVSGVPGESTCVVCHTGTPLNGGGGSVSVTFPAGLTYTPGAKQHLVVTVADPAQRRWGFQLTARLSGNSRTQAGSFTPSDGRTQVLCASTSLANQAAAPCTANLPLEYVEHTLAGYQAAQRTYEFDWTPPSTGVGAVVIYVAGNAANGDLTPFGDHIYTGSYTLNPAAAGGGSTPTIASVVNGASFQPGIVSGSWVTITGTNLASNTRTWTAAEIVDGILPTQLDGVGVTIDGKPAAVYFISPTQLNVQAPTDGALGGVPVVVTTGAGASAPFTAQLESVSPAFFLWAGKYAVATRTDFSLAAPAGLFPGVSTTPAKPGDIVILWGTGFGATNPPVVAGTVVTGAPALANAPSIQIGGVTADFLGGALSPGSAGLYQIAVRIPGSTPDGDIPVLASFGGTESPGQVFIAVQH